VKRVCHAEKQKDRRMCLTTWLGRVDYQEAWGLQRALAGACAEGRVGDVLLLLEHPHVYTIGRRGKTSDLLLDSAGLEAIGARMYEVDRGGEVTYHGPGQIVGYPIINLKTLGIGPMAYVRSLEQVLIDTVADFGVKAERIQGLTGAWVGEAKVAAIGVRISRGVTNHGFAMNVDPDLGYHGQGAGAACGDDGGAGVCCASLWACLRIGGGPRQPPGD